MESDALSIISDGLAAVTEGCRLPVLCSTCTHHLEDDWEGESHETTCLLVPEASEASEGDFVFLCEV